MKKTDIAYELYDLGNDPPEQKNEAVAKPELVQMLEEKCNAWIREQGIVEYAKLLELRPGDNK